MEHTRRKFIATAVAGAAASQWRVAALAQQAYPAGVLSGVIGWGAGGGTDVAMRGYAPYAEEALGRKIVLQNTGKALLVDENVRKAYLGED